MYLLLRYLLPPLLFLSNLLCELKDKLFYFGMPKEPDPFWEFYELRSPEEKFPTTVNHEKKFHFKKGGIPYIIYDLLQDANGNWVSIQSMMKATGKDPAYIRITISQIEKRIAPYKIEPSYKGSYKLIIS